MKFSDYYQYYLSLHQNVWNRRLHYIGVSLTLVSLITFLVYRLWFHMFLLPFISYPFAWIGHFFFEKNKPAAFKNPIYAKIADWRMWWELLIGKQKFHPGN